MIWIFRSPAKTPFVISTLETTRSTSFPQATPSIHHPGNSLLRVLALAGEMACSAFVAAGFWSPSAPNPIPENTISNTNQNIPTIIGNRGQIFQFDKLLSLSLIFSKDLFNFLSSLSLIPNRLLFWLTVE